MVEGKLEFERAEVLIAFVENFDFALEPGAVGEEGDEWHFSVSKGDEVAFVDVEFAGYVRFVVGYALAET